MKGYFATAAAAVVLLACAAEPMDVESAHKAGRGTVAVYDATAEQVWAAAHAAIRWNDVGKPTDHKDQWYVVTDPVAADQVGIWIEPEGNRSRVRVIVMDNPSLPGPYEKQVQDDIGTALQLAAQGKPLDKRP